MPPEPALAARAAAAAADAAPRCRAPPVTPRPPTLNVTRGSLEPAGSLISSRALQGVSGAGMLTIVRTKNASAVRGACRRGARALFRSFSGGFNLLAACWIVCLNIRRFPAVAPRCALFRPFAACCVRASRLECVRPGPFLSAQTFQCVATPRDLSRVWYSWRARAGSPIKSCARVACAVLSGCARPAPGTIPARLGVAGVNCESICDG